MSQANPTAAEATKYAENYVLYGDQSRAWRVAFPKSKAAPESVHARASLFNKNVKVQLRIEDLQKISKKSAEEEFTVTVSDKKKILASVAKQGLAKAKNLSAVVSAVGELNRMDGDHAPTKIIGDPKNPLGIAITSITRTIVDPKKK